MLYYTYILYNITLCAKTLPVFSLNICKYIIIYLHIFSFRFRNGFIEEKKILNNIKMSTKVKLVIGINNYGERLLYKSLFQNFQSVMLYHLLLTFTTIVYDYTINHSPILMRLFLIFLIISLNMLIHLRWVLRH